jgi:hypothetical protein
MANGKWPEENLAGDAATVSHRCTRINADVHHEEHEGPGLR